MPKPIPEGESSMSVTTARTAIISTFLALAFAAPLAAQVETSARRCLQDGVALQGYDAVSFHEAEEPQRGSARFETRYRGALYRFASAESRARFLADPSRYAPRYGGWCAMSLALGRLACPDVLNFRIQDQKLLLFETTLHTNGRVLWERAPRENQRKADRNAKELLGTPRAS